MFRRALVGTTLVAVVATAGSLYFSEIAGFVPCELCWYQRILMYPLVIVLGVAAYESYIEIWKTVLPISVLGLSIAAYHTVLQLRPSAGGACSIDGGCSTIVWSGFGIFTIPRLSLVAFLLITVGVGLVGYLDHSREPAQSIVRR